jgi:hypothetical protein
VYGLLDFEVTKIGKGQLKGMAATHDGFGIEGNFEFDPSLFKSKIEASYKDKEFKFSGNVTLNEGKLPGVQSLSVKVGYANGKVTGEGKAALAIPGVKEIGLRIEQLEDGGLLIAGDIEFGTKLKSAGKVQAVFEKGKEGWEITIKGELNPNISIAGLTIDNVKASFIKGVFDVSANAHFEKGKIKGDFQLGVTNGTVDETGKKTETTGKELIFYASGEVGLLITKGVDTKLKVRISKDGDVFIGGKMEVTEDKKIVEGKSGNRDTDPRLKIWDFKQKIPVASCGVAQLVLQLEAGIGLFYDFKGVTLAQGTNVTLEEINLKELNKAKINSEIYLSTGAKAGVDAYIGASAGLEVLIAGVRGKGKVNLKLTAFDANAKPKVEAGFSPEEGLKFKTAELEFDIESKIGYEVALSVEVYLNLLVTDVTLWEHVWKPTDLQGEFAFSWFDGPLKVPLKFGDNNSVSHDDVSGGLKKEIGAQSKDENTFLDGAKQGVNGKGPDQKEVEQKMEKKMRDQLMLAYRGAHSNEVFAFNSSINEDYFNKRIGAWKKIEKMKSLKQETKDLLQKEMKAYEREEYDAFVTYIKGEMGFDASVKLMIIDEFFHFRPTLTPIDKFAVEALVPPDPKSKTKKKTPTKKKNPIQKKELPGEHSYSIPDDFADRMQHAKPNGLPLPLDVKAEMNRQFGADFSKVRVHYDDESIALTNEVNAQAFTHENHIFFNNGKYEPASSEGRKLLAHELTHVLQQGHGEPVKRVAEKDASATMFTGNYIFNPGRDGLNSSFFNMVKRYVANGTLSDAAIRALRKDAIDRNGTVFHAELLLMAAMRNSVNVPLMQAHRGGSLILSMSNILQADKDYVINFDRAEVPPELANPLLRLTLAALGLSGETAAEAWEAMDRTAKKRIEEIGGKQFNEQANKLIISAGFTKPEIPLPEVLTAMVNSAADSTPGDLIMAGIVYVVARRFGHSTAPYIFNGTIKVDALIPSVYKRLLGGDATYTYSTEEDVRKANTLYVPTDADIFAIDTRALIIHELTHAEDDLNRPTEEMSDSLELESRAYVAQGRHYLEEIIAMSNAQGLVNDASAYVNLGNLFYWSMLLAAKRDMVRYETVFLNACTTAPASKNQSAVKTDLALTEVAISANIRAALLAFRSPGGQQLYSAGNTRLGGSSGHYFQ